jgi:hypothetical protein
MITISGAVPANAALARFVAKQNDNLIGTCATPVPAAAPPKIVTIAGTTDQYMALPPDPQKPLAEAIQKAGQELETALQRGPGAAGPADSKVPVSTPGGQNPF